MLVVRNGIRATSGVITASASSKEMVLERRVELLLLVVRNGIRVTRGVITASSE